MLILIGIVPGFFALNANFDTTKLREPISRIESVISTIDATPPSAPDREKLAAAKEMNADLHVTLDSIGSVNAPPREARFKVRKDILVMDRNLSELMKKRGSPVSESGREKSSKRKSKERT